MASIKPCSRYSSFDSRSSTSSHLSDPASSAELRQTNRRRIPDLIAKPKSKSNTTSGLVPIKAKKNDQNLSAMVKKFMERRPTNHAAAASNRPLVVADFVAQDLKKVARKGTGIGALHKKLFSGKSEKKALMEVKENTRTLSMVLRSERELMSEKSELEKEVEELKRVLETKYDEVEKLKDMCLKQREEIKSLKSAILFPDTRNSHIEEALEKQSAELKQAKHIIPTLQRQVSSLTGQLQCLADDLAEVKADKYSARTCFDGLVSSPKTPEYDQEASNSLEFSSEDPAAPGSPDEMFLKDLNPCLTPYSARTKSEDFNGMGYKSPVGERSSSSNIERWNGINSDTELSGSYQHSGVRKSTRTTCRSDDTKFMHGKKMNQKLWKVASNNL